MPPSWNANWLSSCPPWCDNFVFLHPVLVVILHACFLQLFHLYFCGNYKTILHELSHVQRLLDVKPSFILSFPKRRIKRRPRSQDCTCLNLLAKLLSFAGNMFSWLVKRKGLIAITWQYLSHWVHEPLTAGHLGPSNTIALVEAVLFATYDRGYHLYCQPCDYQWVNRRMECPVPLGKTLTIDIF